jgi:O-methyltransferase
MLLNLVHYPERLLRYHVGWFQDTVPAAAEKIGPIALLRLDGDRYDSTKVCLESLYSNVRRGGIVVIDDYGQFEGCRRAVDEFTSKMPIPFMLHRIDCTGSIG